MKFLNKQSLSSLLVPKPNARYRLHLARSVYPKCGRGIDTTNLLSCLGER
nr:MAG TPA: hypothetical protein [Caudoviricetes sp.]